MVEEQVLSDPRLWIIVAVCLLALYLIDRFCRWIIGRNTRWSQTRQRAARALMVFLFFLLISTVGFYAAVAIIF